MSSADHFDIVNKTTASALEKALKMKADGPTAMKRRPRMKTIKLNGKKINLSIAEERALRTLAWYDFVAPRNAFEEGPRKWRKYILPRGNRAVELGFLYFGLINGQNRFLDGDVSTPASRKRADKYFAKHPRRRICVTGDPRRINAILKKVDGS